MHSFNFERTLFIPLEAFFLLSFAACVCENNKKTFNFLIKNHFSCVFSVAIFSHFQPSIVDWDPRQKNIKKNMNEVHIAHVWFQTQTHSSMRMGNICVETSNNKTKCVQVYENWKSSAKETKGVAKLAGIWIYENGTRQRVWQWMLQYNHWNHKSIQDDRKAKPMYILWNPFILFISQSQMKEEEIAPLQKEAQANAYIIWWESNKEQFQFTFLMWQINFVMMLMLMMSTLVQFNEYSTDWHKDLSSS